MFSAKIPLFLLISTFFLQCTSQEKQIRGSPEVDYPTYYVIPKTSFRCADQLYIPGFYADTEARCQVFHHCYEHRQESFLCPMGTTFNQPILACDYWYSSNCSLAPSYYHVNANKRNEDHFDEADGTISLHSENLFDKMSHLYDTDNVVPESHSENLFDKMSHLYDSENEVIEPSVLKNDSNTTENNFLGEDDVESSGEPLIMDNNKTDDYNKYYHDNQFNALDEEHPEVVKYEFTGSNTLNIHEGSDEQLYEADDLKDFILSEDGMLHPSQKEDANQMYPTDMNFNQGYNEYVEIPKEKIFHYEINEDFNSEGNFQLSDFELQKRYSDVNGGYVRRRPSNRKPVTVIPEAEPEIVQLPAVKHRRKPIGIASTVSTSADTEFSYEANFDSHIYKQDTVLVANEGIKSAISVDLPLDEPNLNLNDYEFRDPKLFYEIQEEIYDDGSSKLHQMESLDVVYDYSNKETGNADVLSNTDENEFSSEIFGSGSNDFLSASNVEHQNTLIDSNDGDESELFIAKAEGSTVLSNKNLETILEGSNFYSDTFLGSGSEDNINDSQSIDGSRFLEDEDIFSDGEDIKTEASYQLPMDPSDAFEGSGVSIQETPNVFNFTEEINVPIQFISKEESEDSIDYSRESGFNSETFGQFPSVEKSEDNEFMPDGSDESNGFTYFPHEIQDSSNNPEDYSDKTIPEIREIDGTYYYIFSDSEHQSNYEYGDSSGFYFENVDYPGTENLEDIPNEMTEDAFDAQESWYPLTDSKTENMVDNDLAALDYEDSSHLENTYEKSVNEFEAETSSDLPEQYIVDGDRQLSNEDLKYLEIMSQTSSPMLNNLFDVSNEKSSSDALKEMPPVEIVSSEHDVDNHATTHEDIVSIEEMPDTEIMMPQQDTNEQAATHKNATSTEEIKTPEQSIYEQAETHENASSTEEMSGTENMTPELYINEQVATHEDPSSMKDVYESESLASDTSSVTEENSTDFESYEKNSEISNAEQIEEEFSDSDGSGENGSDLLLTEDFEEIFMGKESDPFGPLFVESNQKILNRPGSKQKLSLKVQPVQLKVAVANPTIGKNIKGGTRGKRANKYIHQFNPPNKDKPLKIPSTETFRETMFTNIPSAFLKMKHSTWRPYFFNYESKDSGFDPRTGDSFQSSKISKLTSLGKSLLAAKRAKFNIMKRYLDSYRN